MVATLVFLRRVAYSFIAIPCSLQAVLRALTRPQSAQNRRNLRFPILAVLVPFVITILAVQPAVAGP